MFGSHMCFLQMPKLFTEIHKHFTLKLYTHVYMYRILMPVKCLVDSLKYFTFVSHICSLTTIIILVFHVWQSYLFLQMSFKF